MLLETINQVKSVSIGYIGSDGLFDNKTVATYVDNLRGLSTAQAEVVLSSSGLEKAQQKQILLALAATTATKTLTEEY